MWRGRAAALSLGLASAFCLCCLGSLLGQERYLSPPVNLSIKSHNFHTVLKWDVVDASRTSRFNVDFRDYESGEWRPFSPCLNISTHYCDLSEAFKPPLEYVNSYYARIKAVTTSQESNFSCTDRFSFSDNATLGPPIIHLTANGNKLTVEVKCTDANSTASSIKRAFKKLTCNIYYRKREAAKLELEKACLGKIIVTEGHICVSAEVQLDKLKLKGNRSEETCLVIQPSNNNLSDSREFSWSPNLSREAYPTHQSKELDYAGTEGEEMYDDYPEEDEDYPEENDDYPEEDEDPKDTSDELEYIAFPKLQPDELGYGAPKLQPDNTESSRVAISATIGCIVILLLVFAIIYVAYKFNKKELKLPKSLVHIILGRKVYTSVNMGTAESSICVVTTLEQTATNVCEVDLSDERQVEMIKASSDNVDTDPVNADVDDNVDADPVNADVDDSEPVNADLNDPYAAKIGIRGTDQKSVREDNIEVGNSDLDSTHDLCKTISDNMKQICFSDNWGYDKPQIPFDMLLNNTDSVN